MMPELFRGDTVEYIGSRPMREIVRDDKTWPAVTAGDVGQVLHGQLSPFEGDLRYLVSFPGGLPRIVDPVNVRRVPTYKTPDATELLRQAVEHLAAALGELAGCGCPESIATGSAEAAQYAITNARAALAEVPR